MNILVNIIGVIIAFLSLRTGGKEAEVKEKKEGISLGKVALIIVAFWYVVRQFQNSQKTDLESQAPTDITVIQAQAIHKALHPYSNPTGVDGLDYNELLQIADEILKQNVAKVTSNYQTLFGISLGGDIGKELTKNQSLEFYARLNKTTTKPNIVINKGDEVYAREDLTVWKTSDTTKVQTTIKKGESVGDYLGKYFKVNSTGRVYILIDLNWTFNDGYVDISKVYKL